MAFILDYEMDGTGRQFGGDENGFKILVINVKIKALGKPTRRIILEDSI
jgi:hypothetical protein